MLARESFKKVITSNTDDVWRSLNGIFVVYKPQMMGMNRFKEILSNSLAEELSSMHVRRPQKYVSILGDTTKPMKVVVHDSFAHHELVMGPRYLPRDFRISVANHLNSNSSGVMVCGINSGLPAKLAAAKAPKFYRVKGVFGRASHNYFKTGRTVEKSTYDHITRNAIDKRCASMQSSHQAKIFDCCGVDIQSQAAYELASKGLIRPDNDKVPILYAIKCIRYYPPEFTLEIVCVNETEMYLKTIVHELGILLKSTATCIQLQCYQYGIFNLEMALLRKYWHLKEIAENMSECMKFVKQRSYLFKQQSPTLIESSLLTV